MTSAAKPNRRPPLTTLATRLMPTSFSVNSLSSRSRGWRSPSPPRRPSRCVRAIGPLSEIEPALAGGVGQGLDPAVIQIGAAVEHDPRDPGRLGAFGEQFANRARRSLIGTGLQVLLEPGIEGRSRGERAPGQIVDDLCVDMARRAEHRQPHPALRRLAQLEPGPVAPAAEQRIWFVRHGRYFFLPSLRRIISSRYLTPLPL